MSYFSAFSITIEPDIARALLLTEHNPITIYVEALHGSTAIVLLPFFRWRKSKSSLLITHVDDSEPISNDIYTIPVDGEKSVAVNLTVLARKSRTASLCDVTRCAQNRNVHSHWMCWTTSIRSSRSLASCHFIRCRTILPSENLCTCRHWHFIPKQRRHRCLHGIHFDDTGYMRKFPKLPYLVQFWHFACVWRKFFSCFVAAPSESEDKSPKWLSIPTYVRDWQSNE